MKEIKKVWNTSKFISSDEETRLCGRIQDHVTLLETSLFPKWVKAIYNYSMFTWDRIENLLMKWYKKQDIARMSDYFHPMIYRIINTMYWYLLDRNFTITAHGWRKCWQDIKVQKNAEWYWRQKSVFKNMMKIIKQSILLGQCWGMPYVERVYGNIEYIDGKPKSRKKEYIEDYVTAWLYKVSPFHLFYDPHIDWEDQEEVSHCRMASWDSIMKELYFITYDDWVTKIKKEDRVNYFSLDDQKIVKNSWARFCEYDFSRVHQVWRERYNNGSISNKLADCLNSWSHTWHFDQYRIEKSNELYERTFSFRMKDCERHLAVFINKKLIYDWPSPFGNYLPYKPIYYKEPMEWSVERWLGILLEQPQEVANNSYRAKHDTTRTNNINGSISVIEWHGQIKKNWVQVDWKLELNKWDVIHVGKDVKISNFPIANINQNDQDTINDANALGDYTSNLNNVTWGQNSKITRVSWEVISKKQVTQRELEPMVMSIEDFVTWITEIVMQQIQLIVKKKYKVFIMGEEYEIDIKDLKWRYSWTWSTSRIAELYREINAERENAALEAIASAAPDLINWDVWAKTKACSSWLPEDLIMSRSDASKLALNRQRQQIENEIKLLPDQLRLAEERNKIFPPAPAWEENSSIRTNVNVNYKDITNPLVKQEVLAEMWAESALQVDPVTLMWVDNKEAIQTPVGFIETTQWVWQPWTPWVLVDQSSNNNISQVIDLAENV